MNKRLLCMLLALSMSASLACGSAGGTSDTTTDSQNTSSDTTTAIETELTDNLPERDYKGADFNLLVRTERLYYLDAEEETGDTLNDAVYKRNRTVEERFNINLVYTDVKSDKGMFTSAIQASIMADDEGYDIITPDYWWTLDREGYFLNLNELEYLDFDKPWWSKNYIDCVTINDVCFTAVGSLCLDLLRNVEVVYFNKGLIEDYKLENPYELVESGKWTLEKLRTMGTAVSADVNGDTVYDENDRYGIYMNHHAREAIYSSFGSVLVDKNSNGELELSVMNEHYISISEQLYDMLNSDPSVLFGSDITVDFTTTAAYVPFNQNNLLFTMFALTAVEAMRQTNVEFGIVPVPKFDEAQENYIAHNYGCTLMTVPVNAPDEERSAIILEALNYESWKTIQPQYYEMVLQGKLARDNESVEMLDLIFENIEFDIGFVNTIALDMHSNPQKDPASYYAGKQAQYESALQKLVDAYAALGK